MKEIKKGISILLVLMVFSSLVVSVNANNDENDSYNTEYIASDDSSELDIQTSDTNRIIVKFNDRDKKPSPRKLKSRKLNSKISEEQQIDFGNEQYSVITASDNGDVNELIQTICKEYGDAIDLIQPDYIIGSYSNEDEISINDIEVTEQQEIEETLQEQDISTTAQTQIENLDIEEDIIVAVIDTALDYNHDALSGAVYSNSLEVADGIDNDGNGYIDDICGWDFINSNDITHSTLQSNHGTHVAGLITAEGIGVGTHAKILPLNVFNEGVAYTSDIIAAIEYAESMGAKIVNCSWGSSMANPILEDTIRNSDMLFVCAAGNSGVNLDDNPVYPASYDLDNILTVGAANDRDYLAYFSNYGDSVDVTANGYKINSTYVNNHYGIMTGTSMSTAYVSGVAAEVYNGSAVSTKNLILSTSDRVSTLVDKVNLGRRVNPINALNEVIVDDIIENTCIDYEEEHYQQILQDSEEYRLFDLDPEITKVYAGLQHSVTINNWGLVNTFGDNTYNQLGETSGTYGATAYCHAVAGLDYIEKVSTFANHNLALSGNDGTVYAWGDNSRYQLAQINGSSNAMPTEVEFFKSDGTSPTIVDVIAGGWYSLALDDEGNVWGWGDNTYGQMAQGYTGYCLTTPRIIMSEVSCISAGKYHVLAVKNGIAYGWGRNAGDCALGSNADWAESSPIQIAGLPSTVIKVVAGDRCSFFFTSEGVYALGANENGQLGDGTTTNKGTPQLLSLSGIQDVISNGFTLFDCGSTYYVCGPNNYGQLGQGYPNTRITTPVVLPIDDPQVYSQHRMAVGGYHSLFFAVNNNYPEDEWYYRNARVYATGRNDSGQSLGNGERFIYPTKVYEVENTEDLGDFAWDNMHLRPIDSTYISQHGDDAQENFYNDSLKVRYTGSESGNGNWGEYSYLKFDVSNIQKEKIASAKLYFYVLNTGDFRESAREIGVYDTYTNEWNGQNMTWNVGRTGARNLIGSFAVSANGYMISPQDIGWHEVDITNYLKNNCIDNTLSLMLKSVSTQAYETVIASGVYSESFQFSDMHRNRYIPVLSLEYASDELMQFTRNSYTPSYDTYIYQHTPNNSLNFVDSEFLGVNYTSDGSRTDFWGQDSYISFNMNDLNELERNSIINAKLWVYIDKTSDARNSTRTVSVTANEGWNYLPTLMRWDFGRPTGNYQVGEFTVSGNGYDVIDYGWKAIDVTEFLNDTSNNSVEFIMKMTSTQAHPIKIRSNEYADVSTRPRLVIDIDKQYHDDVRDTEELATAISVNELVSKTFWGTRDKDCFSIDIEDAGVYDLEFLTNDSLTGSIIIKDENKKQICHYDNSDDSTYRIKLASGRYYIILSPKTGNFESGYKNYTFKISQVLSYQKMNVARHCHWMAAVNGELYAMGGYNSQSNTDNTIEKYNSTTHMWEAIEESDNIAHPNANAISIGGTIYFVGGIYDSVSGNYSISTYNTETGDWTSSGNNLNRGNVGLAVKDNNIYIVGGERYLPSVNQTEIKQYNTATGAMTTYAVLPNDINLKYPQPFFVGNTLYVVEGGVFNENETVNTIYAYDNGIWTQKTSIAENEYVYLRGKEYNNNFYVAAVKKSFENNENNNVDILKYDTENDTWTVLYEDFIINRANFAVEIMNGMMYITGGYSTDTNSINNDMYIYDVVTDISSMSDVSIRTMGFEYEQQVDSTATSPEIIGVNAKQIDGSKGIYELYLNEGNYVVDPRSIPFFFWSAREGTFKALSDNYQRVLFYADPNTGDRKVKVVVGIGDGRGYSDKKAFYLTGNSETE